MVAEAVVLGDAPEVAETLESLLSTRTFDPSSFSVPIAVVTSDGEPELPSILPRQLLPTPSRRRFLAQRTRYFFSCYRVSSRVSSSHLPTIQNRVQNCGNTHTPHLYPRLAPLASRRPRLSETRSSAMHEQHSVGEGPITVPSGTRTPRGTTRRRDTYNDEGEGESEDRENERHS